MKMEEKLRITAIPHPHSTYMLHESSKSLILCKLGLIYKEPKIRLS